MEPSFGELLVLLLAGIATTALLFVLPRWHPSADLPVWKFPDRGRAGLGQLEALRVEVNCELCDSQAACRRLAGTSGALPPPGCPNAGLFEERARR